MSRVRLSALVLIIGVGPIPAPVRADGDASRPVLYKLGRASTFQQGCFEGCACPITEQVAARGTFWLTFLQFDGLFAHYAVDDVNWTVDLGEPRLHVTGFGTYRVGGEFAVMHQLELDLVVGDDPVQHFDSGLVSGGGEFPQIDILISMNNMYCYDRVFDLHARPLGDADGDGDVDLADMYLLQAAF